MSIHCFRCITDEATKLRFLILEEKSKKTSKSRDRERSKKETPKKDTPKKKKDDTVCGFRFSDFSGYLVVTFEFTMWFIISDWLSGENYQKNKDDWENYCHSWNGSAKRSHKRWDYVRYYFLITVLMLGILAGCRFDNCSITFSKSFHHDRLMDNAQNKIL